MLSFRLFCHKFIIYLWQSLIVQSVYSLIQALQGFYHFVKRRCLDILSVRTASLGFENSSCNFCQYFTQFLISLYVL